MRRRNSWVPGIWLALVVAATPAANPPDYTPLQWAQIDMLRKAAIEHADARASEACAWKPAQPDTPIDMVAPDAVPVSVPVLREKLMAMLKEDQASRDVMLAVNSPVSRVRVGYGDARHRNELLAIVNEYGFPTTAMVGESGVWAMFYLSAHADEDIALQQRLLGLMKQVAGTNAIPAYLPDMFLTIRRNVPMGKPYAEVYGVDRVGQEKGNGEPSIPADPRSCFAFKRQMFAKEWLRGHLPMDIVGASQQKDAADN